MAANGNEPQIERVNSACLRHVSVGLAQRGSLARRRQRSARIPPTLAPCSSRRDLASATTMSPDFATCRCLFVARRGRPLLRRVSNAGVIVLLLALAGCGPSPSHLPERSSTAWAYPMPPPCSVSRTSCRARYSITGARSRVSFSSNEKKNLFLAPDWQPDQRPPMPPVVAKGRKPGLMACAFCHLPTGDGRPENAVLAGLPRDHIIEQMRAFRDGTRRSSVVTRYPTILMTVVAKAATDAEIVAAADYFSSHEHHAFAEFVKTDRVPRTQTRGWVYSPRFEGDSEPIGARIIEMPVDFERFEHRDPSIRYFAYAPVGSVTRGERLARTWGGAGQQACASCHGHDLRGIGQAPPLAGRSPNLYCPTTQRS